MDVDALFKGMKDAPIFGRGNYMNEGGVFEVEIKKLFLKNREKDGVSLFICEFEILQSSNPKYAVGSTGSWATKIQGIAANSAWGDIKCLMFAALDRDPKEVPAGDKEAHDLVTALARAACGSDSAKAELKATHGIDDVNSTLSGVRVHLETSLTKTREGRDFTRYTWSPSRAAA